MKNPGQKGPWEPKKFRTWLISKLSATVWMHRSIANQPLDETARQLGVRTDVLLDAHKLVRAKMDRSTRVAGLAPIKIRHDGQRATLTKPCIVHLVMPQEIHELWSIFRDRYGFTDSVLLRSLIHHGLLLKHQPRWVGRGWPYHGKMYRCHGFQSVDNKWPWDAVTQISYGAHQALLNRIRSARITKSAFIRGLVLEMLTGKIQSFDAVTEVSQMFEVDRYVSIEGQLENRALVVQGKEVTP